MPEQALVSVFIDFHNICPTNRGWDMDFDRLIELTDRFGTVTNRFIYIIDFDIMRLEHERHGSGFGHMLKDKGFTVREKQIRRVYDTQKGTVHSFGNHDVEIAIDVMDTLHNGPVDTIMLFSGDGDFCPLLKRVQERRRKIHTIVVSWEKQASRELVRLAHEYIPLERHKSELQLQSDTARA